MRVEDPGVHRENTAYIVHQTLKPYTLGIPVCMEYQPSPMDIGEGSLGEGGGGGGGVEGGRRGGGSVLVHCGCPIP